MAIAVDSQMPSKAGTSQARNIGLVLTYNFTNTAGTILVVHGLASDVTACTQPDVKVNNTTITKISSAAWNVGESMVTAWYMLNPPTGNLSIAVSSAGTGSASGQVISGAISFTGADTVSPIGNILATNNATTSNVLGVSVPSVTLGSYVISNDGMGSNHSTTPGDRTSTWIKDVDGGSAGNNAFAQFTSNVSGSVVLKHNCSASDWIGAVGFELKAAAAATYVPYTIIPQYNQTILVQ